MINTDRSHCLNSADKRNRLSVSMFELAPDAMLVIDLLSNISIANSRAEQLFQCFDFEKSLVSAECLFPEWANLKSEISSIDGKNAKVITTRALTQAGTEFVAEIELSKIEFDGTEHIGLIVRDVSKIHMERRQLETTFQSLQDEKTRLEFLVKQDPLTQLFNRRGLETILSREIEYARRNNSSLLATIVDLDDFKRVNDTYGHFTGDIVLRHVAGILKGTVRVIDWVGRVGGDEFLILLPGTVLSKGVMVAERVRMELERNLVETADGPISQTASFGLVALPLSICSIEEVLELTKCVLKESKCRGKNCVSSSESANGENKAGDQSITSVLRELDRCESYSQPIVDLRSKETVGFKRVICGRDGSDERIDQWFRLSQQNNTVALLDLQCLQKALAVTDEREKRKICHVSLCASTLLDVPVAKLLEKIRERIQTDQDVCLELSAKKMLSSSLCLLEPIKELKRHGIKIALTDVGSGNSSLEFLLYVIPDYIKLDRTLVSNISTGSDNADFIRTLIKMLSQLPVRIIAEGIASESELSALRELGIMYGQGPLFQSSASIKMVPN